MGARIQGDRCLAGIAAYCKPENKVALGLCIRKITPEQRRALDLSCWEVALDAAEPVRAGTLDRFAAAFAPCGFRLGSSTPIEPAELRAHAPFARQGLSSLATVSLAGDLAAWLECPLSPTLLYEYILADDWLTLNGDKLSYLTPILAPLLPVH